MIDGFDFSAFLSSYYTPLNNKIYNNVTRRCLYPTTSLIKTASHVYENRFQRGFSV